MPETSRRPRRKPVLSGEAAMTAAAPWYAEGLCFSCTQCGNCCTGPPGHVWVSTAELAAIAHDRRMKPEQFSRCHARQVGSRLSLLELPGGDCEFLERLPGGNTACRIHRVRPLQCRTWPFWESNLHSHKTWNLAARNCPGIDSGGHHPLPVIRGALQLNAVAGLPL